MFRIINFFDIFFIINFLCWGVLFLKLSLLISYFYLYGFLIIKTCLYYSVWLYLNNRWCLNHIFCGKIASRWERWLEFFYWTRFQLFLILFRLLVVEILLCRVTWLNSFCFNTFVWAVDRRIIVFFIVEFEQFWMFKTPFFAILKPKKFVQSLKLQKLNLIKLQKSNWKTAQTVKILICIHFKLSHANYK